MTAPRMVAWRDVEAGSVVSLKGADWRVEKVKTKGKTTRVRVTGRAGTFEREVKSRDEVELVDGHASGGPLRDSGGAMRRWATDAEHDAEEASRGALGLPGGRHGAKPKPETSKGPRWDAPATDAAGVAVETGLGAVLIAETPDEPAGYFVPPIDITAVRAHLALFHGMPGNEQPIDEARCLEAHKLEHDAIDDPSGDNLVRYGFVNHWHTKRRPGRDETKG